MSDKKHNIHQFSEQDLQLLFGNFMEKLCQTQKTFLLLTNVSDKKDQKEEVKRTRFTIRGQPSVLADTVHSGLHGENICIPFFCGMATFLEEKGYKKLSIEIMNALKEIHPPLGNNKK